MDFDPNLSEIVSETKYLEQLGFSVPELARNVALQVSKRIMYNWDMSPEIGMCAIAVHVLGWSTWGQHPHTPIP